VLVWRHQLAVLGRQEKRPALRPADRAILVALARVLPQQRRHGLIVTPQTLLRWHPELMRRQLRAGRLTTGEIKRRDQLGGLIHEWFRNAGSIHAATR
jgi:putative transposase